MQGTGGRDLASQTRKIFIGGLNYKTDEESLKNYFSKFGELVDCIVMKFPDTKRSRGFGFVTYSTDEEVDACQENRPHVIDGKQVETKRATPREARDNGDAAQTVKKVFVGGIPEEVEDEEIKAYFEEFGPVVAVTRSTDKETGKRKRFAFVEFNDYDPVDKAIIKGNHEIGGRHVDVKKAVSRQDMAMGGGGGGRGARGGRGRGGGGWGGGRGQFQDGNQWGAQGGWGQGQAWGAAAGGWGGASGDYSYQAGGAADWSSGAGGYGGAEGGYSQGGYGGGPMRSAGAGAGGGYRTAPYGTGMGGNGFQGGNRGSGGGYRGGM